MKWTCEEQAMRRRNVMVSGADLCAEILADVRRVLDAESTEPLTLPQAAKRSGFSADHLGRLVRQGTIPNAGRRNAPRILARDLPRKPKGALAESPSGPYDPETDARTLLSRQRGGRHA